MPALQHNDAVVTEAAAICAYLAYRFPEAHLVPPPNHPSWAAYFRWLFFAAGPLEMAITSKALGWVVPEGKNVMAGFGSFEATIDALEKALKPGPYICRDQFTAADVYVGAQINWGLMFGSIERRPLFEEYVARINARPAAVAANRINEERLKATAAK